MLGGVFSSFPFLALLVWVGLVVYLLLLATRLVSAVEHIAREMTQRVPGSSGS